MKKLTLFIFVFWHSNAFSGLLSPNYTLEEATIVGQSLPPSESVVMLEGGAPTGTLIHPMVVLTCAHSTHIPGEIVKFVDDRGKDIFVTRLRHALIPKAYQAAIEESLSYANIRYAQEIGDELSQKMYRATLSLSFMKFMSDRGIRLLKEQKGAKIMSEKESEADVQLLFLADVVPTEISKPVPMSIIFPRKEMALQTISYGPVFGKQGSLRKINNMYQNDPYLRHAYESYFFDSNGKLYQTKFLETPSNAKGKVKLGSIVPGDSGSPVFIYNNIRKKWEIQGINVASFNGYSQYLPGVQATICSLSHHLGWINEQMDKLLDQEKGIKGYVPQLAFERERAQKMSMFDMLHDGITKNDKSGASFKLSDNQGGRAYSAAVNNLPSKASDDTVISDVNQQAHEVLHTSSQENEVMVVDWYNNRAPSSVMIRAMQDGEVKAWGSFGGTMAFLDLPYGEYQVAVQFAESPKVSQFLYSHRDPSGTKIRQKWVRVSNLSSDEQVFEGWVEGKKSLDLASLGNGVYSISDGKTSLHQRRKLILVDNQVMPKGVMSLEQDGRHENKILLNWKGIASSKANQDNALLFDIVDSETGNLVHPGIVDSEKKLIDLPWGNYLVNVHGNGESTQLPYRHFKHPIIKNKIKAVIDDKQEAIFVDTKYGSCNKMDLSLLSDGKYKILTDDGKGGIKKLHAFVAHGKLPSDAVLVDLSGDNLWRVNWFYDQVEGDRNFKFGYEGKMVDARKVKGSHTSFLRPASQKFNLEYINAETGKKEVIEMEPAH